MVKIGQTVTIGTDAQKNRVCGIAVWVHPRGRFVLTERDVPYGGKIRECVMMGKRRGQLTRTAGCWYDG